MILSNWKAQDYYNEYLELKESIVNLNHYLDNRHLSEEYKDSYKMLLENRIQRFKYILAMLKESGVNMEELILLSVGIDV